MSTKICLLDKQGQPKYRFDVPSQFDQEIGKCGSIVFEGQSYRFTRTDGSVLYAEPVAPSFELNHQWLSEEVEVKPIIPAHRGSVAYNASELDEYPPR